MSDGHNVINTVFSVVVDIQTDRHLMVLMFPKTHLVAEPLKQLDTREFYQSGKSSKRMTEI